MKNYTIKTNRIRLRDLDSKNLHQFYEGMHYRYNSVTDLILSNSNQKNNLLDILGVRNDLLYRVDFLLIGNEGIPILECLEIDGVAGGMLSTYLHDLDRDIIEGGDEIKLSHHSRWLWDCVLSNAKYNFVFGVSKNKISRTSIYLSKVGFTEKRKNNFRYFYNSPENIFIFDDVMNQFTAAIQGGNKLYDFNKLLFNKFKSKQRVVVNSFIKSNLHQFRYDVEASD